MKCYRRRIIARKHSLFTKKITYKYKLAGQGMLPWSANLYLKFDFNQLLSFKRGNTIKFDIPFLCDVTVVLFLFCLYSLG